MCHRGGHEVTVDPDPDPRLKGPLAMGTHVLGLVKLLWKVMKALTLDTRPLEKLRVQVRVGRRPKKVFAKNPASFKGNRFWGLLEVHGGFQS